MGFLSKLSNDRKYEISGVILLAMASFLFLALATDSYQGDSNRSISNLGTGGSLLANILYILIGHASHFVYFMLGAWGLMMLRHQPVDRIGSRFAGTFLLIASVAGFLHINFDQQTEPGGAVGAFVTHLTQPMFGYIGANVIMVTLALVGLLLATEFLFIRMLNSMYHTLILVIRSIDKLRLDLQGSREKSTRKPKASEKVITVRAKEPADPDAVPWYRTAWSFAASLLQTKRSKVRSAVEAVRRNHSDEDPGDLSRMRVSSLTTETAPDTETITAPEPASVPVPDEAAQLELPRDDRDTIVISSGPSPGQTPNTKRLRRKTFEEELPADYVYPKRYARPTLDLFEEPPEIIRHDLTNTLRETGVLLEETLQTFGIEARVTDITRGPTITRFELEPAQGVKVNRFIALTDDIALALKAHGVRVEAPIPGKGKVGIEIPNRESEAVFIRDLLQSRAFKSSLGKLTLALGKDIAGEVVSADLATMPHLLVAGATGAGKTVCIKTVLASLLVTKTPDELQLMLIDPKMVELSIFNDIPHLITPVVIDPKKAASSLTWLINEMEERYKLFAHLRVRNIEVYNESVDNGEIEVEQSEDEDTENIASIRQLPYIVCIIDELADLMMLARAEVEDAIARLAQLARAVGIHLIIATQRPSVDVLTGVIKANFPSRISFQVSSRVDSRCILDEIGAERLIGRGDMLYLPPGQSKPLRIQGAFVSDDDMNTLIAYLKRQAPPQYRDEIENFGKQTDTIGNLADESDELFDDAVRVVIETGQASISMVQRRLRVGYTRAARLIDMMELKGIVGPHMGSKARDILVSVPQGSDEVA